MDKTKFFQTIKGELIVSCQALPGEPLYGSDYMSKMSLAAKLGGAVAIRANGANDVMKIKKATELPVVGLIKRDYPDSSVFITPTKKEILELIEAKTDVIALDATHRKRPNDETLEELIKFIKKNSNCLIMADISTLEEGLESIQLGVDMVSTTLSSYTPYTKHRLRPDLQLVEDLANKSNVPVIAEGNIKSPQDAVNALKSGAFSIVVGTAITRPQIITKEFVNSIRAIQK